MYSETLVEAVEGDDAPAVEAALAAGADVNARLKGGGTLLMRAASEGRLTVLQALLRGGADVDAKREDGMTALMFASFFGHVDVVSALLDRGADMYAEDIHNSTALRLASSRCHVEVKKLLERAGAGNVSTESPAEVKTSEEEARGAEQGLGVSVPPPGELSTRSVARPLRAGGVSLLAAGACVVVLLLAGFQRTIVRKAEGTAERPAASPAVDPGAQLVTPLAPPRGQEETAAVEPVAAAAPAPPQRDRTAENAGKNVAAAEPGELPKAPAPGRHLAEPAVVSTVQTSATPSTVGPRPPEVKEINTPPPAEQSRGVTVVTTLRDAPRSRTRQGEQSPTVAPPLSSPTTKKRVIPWP